MLSKEPENTLMLLESTDIYDGWAAALLDNGDIVNRWDPKTEARRHAATEELIKQFIKDYEPKGFEGEW